MKKVFRIALAIILLMPATSYAQDAKSVLSDIISKVGSSTTSSVKDVLGSLTGTTAVSKSSLTGTWTYSRPAIAFESSNLLNKAGGSVISNAIENKVATQLAKYGIKAGLMTFTFADDKTFTCKVGKRTTTGTYALSGANITFTYLKVKTIKANVKLSGSSMQITFAGNKLLTFLQGLNTLDVSNSTLSTISSVMKSYSGMQVGMEFKK